MPLPDVTVKEEVPGVVKVWILRVMPRSVTVVIVPPVATMGESFASIFVCGFPMG